MNRNLNLQEIDVIIEYQEFSMMQIIQLRTDWLVINLRMLMDIIQLYLMAMVAGKSLTNAIVICTHTLTRTSKELKVKSRSNKLSKVHLTRLNKNGLRSLALVLTLDSQRQLM